MATFTRRISRSCTWTEVKEIVKSGRASQEFEVGDEFKETLTSGEQIIIAVKGIDIYAKNQIVLGLKNCLEDRYFMNDTWTNKGGWLASYMRKYLSSTILGTFPEELRSVITPRTLHLSGKPGGNKLWLPSEFEVFGQNWCSKEEADGDVHLPYYQKAENRRKKLGIDGSAYLWWERSPHYYGATHFCFVGSNGGANSYSASITFGVAPCFLI
jgi:hypothetical protein